MLLLLFVLLSTVAAAVGASVVMTRASGASPLWNMALGGLLAVAALGGAVALAWLLTRAAFS